MQRGAPLNHENAVFVGRKPLSHQTILTSPPPPEDGVINPDTEFDIQIMSV